MINVTIFLLTALMFNHFYVFSAEKQPRGDGVFWDLRFFLDDQKIFDELNNPVSDDINRWVDAVISDDSEDQHDIQSPVASVDVYDSRDGGDLEQPQIYSDDDIANSGDALYYVNYSSYRCPLIICNQYFNSSDYLFDHITQCHGDHFRSYEEISKFPPRYRCTCRFDNCNEFFNEDYLICIDLNNDHANQCLYQCPKSSCHFFTKESQILARHFIDEHGDEN